MLAAHLSSVLTRPFSLVYQTFEQIIRTYIGYYQECFQPWVRIIIFIHLMISVFALEIFIFDDDHDLSNNPVYMWCHIAAAILMGYIYLILPDLSQYLIANGYNTAAEIIASEPLMYIMKMIFTYTTVSAILIPCYRRNYSEYHYYVMDQFQMANFGINFFLGIIFIISLIVVILIMCNKGLFVYT